MEFKYGGGRRCLDFAGTLRHRSSSETEELLTSPQRLSDWAVQGGLVDTAIELTDDDVAAAIALREAMYRIVSARLGGSRPDVADVDLVNEHASAPQLTPRLHPDGSVGREGTAAQLLARLAADLLDLLAGPDIDKVKRCSHAGCTRLYIDASRAQNRHWCGMSTCGNRAKVQAFRARQRAAAARP
ncbi:CGNR zinc finger domain-containing protein [Mycobacterium sp.]|uniref:CGNR zinc finger domain-containing protein n=1 Tax=Mycobacterium sp. TaxID=1785 RepID=UPI002BDB2557|nr:CGNR zinc finger domain-containing protein [Mycobacterium sp.]HTQ22160.1 CGNR zinc finger domain-containing protein [Mycobacterium sp.]